MRRLVRICRKEVLPLLGGDLLVLIELAAECLLPPGSWLPFARRRIKAKQRRAALEALWKGFDWSKVDPTILGILYESLLDPVRGDSAKQGRRRRSGIFYTPPYITRYLCRAAIDACVPSLRKSPPRVLDPACGGGAFLLAAFRELVRRYPDENAEDIAASCLRGVDSDPAAVHVARLSLWLEAGLHKDDWPLLHSSIRVGDSLREGLAKDHDRFPVVVGNPPYRNVKRGIPGKLRTFCKAHYRSARGQWDLSAPFVELALDHLLEPGGACGLIVPNPLLLAENYQPTREIILENDLVAFGPVGAPFADPGVEASLLVVRAGRGRRRTVAVLEGRALEKVVRKRAIPSHMLHRLPFRVFSHSADPETIQPLMAGLDSGELVRLGDTVRFTRGIECGKRDSRVRVGKPKGSRSRPLIVGEAVRPFHASPTHSFAVPPSRGARRVLKDPDLWSGESRLLLRRVAGRPIAAVVSPPALVLNTLYVVRGGRIDQHATCALLNSRPFRELFRRLFAFDDRLFPYLRASQLSSVPVCPEALADSVLAGWSIALHEMAASCQGNLEGKGAETILAGIDKRVGEMYNQVGVTLKAPRPPPQRSRRS